MRQAERDAVADAMGYEVEDEVISDAVFEHEGQSNAALKTELRRAERQFRAQGERGVDLAEQIDRLRIALAVRSIHRRGTTRMGSR